MDVLGKPVEVLFNCVIALSSLGDLASTPLQGSRQAARRRLDKMTSLNYRSGNADYPDYRQFDCCARSAGRPDSLRR